MTKKANAGHRGSHSKRPGRNDSPEKLAQAFLDREKKLLAYELHDGLVQHIVGAKLMAEVFLTNHPRLKSELRVVLGQLDKALVEARRIVAELRPLVLQGGLALAIQELVADHREQGKLSIRLDVAPNFPRLESSVESSLFRVVQEALTNVVHHARCREATVRLNHNHKEISLVIADSGVGFDPRRVSPDRFGLEGIRDRVAILGGRVSIQSQTGKGTKVRVRIPQST